DSLRLDIAKLAQLLQPQANNNVAANTPSLGDLGALLKDNVAQIRGQLQKFQAQNDAVFAQAKANFEAQIANSLGNAPSSQDASSKNTPASTNTVAANNNTPGAALTAPVTPAVDTSSLNVAPVVSSGITQGSANNSGGNNSSSSNGG